MTLAPKPKSAAKRVYIFGTGASDGGAGMRNLLGGKGANLAEMASLGLPVPPGFTITTEVCTAYYTNGGKFPEGLIGEAEAALASVGTAVGATFGDARNPLLVSVRSGARASMPGMMDTILNLGLNDATVAGLAARSGDARFAYDSYRRFIQMYSGVVLDVEHHTFEQILDNQKPMNGHSLDTDLGPDDWRTVIARLQSRHSRKAPASPSRRIPASSSGARSVRCSGPGRTSAPSPIAACTPFPTIGAPPSMSRRWCSAIAGRPRRRALPSPAILRPAPTRSTASSWSMRRARTWSPASARRSR